MTNAAFGTTPRALAVELGVPAIALAATFMRAGTRLHMNAVMNDTAIAFARRHAPVVALQMKAEAARMAAHEAACDAAEAQRAFELALEAMTTH